MGVREVRFFFLNVIAEDERTGRDEAVRLQSRVLPNINRKAGLSSGSFQEQLRSLNPFVAQKQRWAGLLQAEFPATQSNSADLKKIKIVIMFTQSSVPSEIGFCW